MKDKDFKLLEDYMDNLLGLTQKNEIEQRLKNEPELLETLNNIRKTKAVISADEEMEIWDIIHEVEEERKVQDNSLNPSKKSFNKFWIIASIIAAILIIAFTLLKQTSDVDKQMIAQDFTVKEKSVVVRGTSDFSQDSIIETTYILPMNQVNELVEEGNYQKAQQKLNTISADFPLAKQNIEYTKALIYYLNNGRDNPEFHRILNKILDDPTHNCYKLAVKLDNEVNSIWGRIKG